MVDSQFFKFLVQVYVLLEYLLYVNLWASVIKIIHLSGH